MTMDKRCPKIDFIYGDVDWMDPGHALMLIQSGQMLDIASLHIVEGAGHHLYLDNPEGVVEKMILSCFGADLALSYRTSKQQS